VGCINLGSWSTARLAAETVVVPVEETNLSSAAPEVARGAGGVIFFGTSAPSNLAGQVSGLESDVPEHVGLLVMTDEEGGGIQRMPNLVGSLPWPSYMGANWTPAEITSAVATVARHMMHYGVNMDLAPVLDVDGRAVEPGDQDPDGFRSFSGSTAVVSQDGVAYMRGLLAGGVIPVVKHFPGLGGATANTDVASAKTLPWSTLQQVAIPPFAAAVAAGAPAVMISNAIVPGLTNLPASLSSAVIEGQLEGALHFHGLVMTDSLTAKAISAAGFSVAGAALKAIEAGADMVIYGAFVTPSATNNEFTAIVNALVNGVDQGELARSRLVAAAAAVLAARHVNVCS
jgi:beta-N-acetylhexosaminidase